MMWFQCPYCKRLITNDKENVKVHVRTHHPEKPELEDEDIPDVENGEDLPPEITNDDDMDNR